MVPTYLNECTLTSGNGARGLGTFLEFQGHTVQAITQTCRRRSIIEDVTEMRSAPRAKYFVTVHSEAVIFHRHNISGNEWPGETRPARAGFKLSVTGKKGRAAAGTSKNAATMLAQQNGQAREFGGFAAKNRVLLGSQLSLPFGVCLHNSRDGRQISRTRLKRFGCSRFVIGLLGLRVSR